MASNRFIGFLLARSLSISANRWQVNLQAGFVQVQTTLPPAEARLRQDRDEAAEGVGGVRGAGREQ